MSNPYVASLIDPFDQSLPQPKLFDGSVTRSSGVRFRSTGTITLDGTGATNFIVLFPGFSTNIAWKRTADATYLNPIANDAHLSTPTERLDVKQIRKVSCGLRLSLLNSSDDNEGYWEAVRVPLETASFVLQDVTAPLGENFMALPIPTFGNPFANMANHTTYQTGKLKDIDRFLFKLNSIAPLHPWKTAPAVPVVADVLDPTFDVVVIKITGRIDATVPSNIMYDTVSNQEVVYTENTPMSRLQTFSPMVPGTDVLLDKTRFILPAIQIA